MPFNESAYQRISCNTETPVIRLAYEQVKTVPITLRDADGNEVEAEVDSTVTLSTKCTYNSSSILFSLAGVATADPSIFDFPFTAAETAEPGLYLGTVGVFNSASELTFAMPVYLEVTPTALAAVDGPLSVPEVRMALMDTCPGANYLLDELEFSDSDIIFAMRRTVDTFNEINPPVCIYSCYNFPHRSHWIKGTIANLLASIAHKYRRNSLQYSAGGLSVADQEKAREYDAMAAKMDAEFLQWAERKKVTMNMSRCWGRVG